MGVARRRLTMQTRYGSDVHPPVNVDIVSCSSVITDGTTASPDACDALVDKASCNNAVTRSVPADQCALCCLNHGFINAEYTAVGEPECACS